MHRLKAGSNQRLADLKQFYCALTFDCKLFFLCADFYLQNNFVMCGFYTEMLRNNVIFVRIIAA